MLWGVKRHVIDSDETPAGEPLVLRREEGHYQVLLGGELLMSSAAHYSEQRMAEIACEGLGPGARVLIGGLGMGFTLRAALDRLAEDATVVVFELVPAIVAWNRGPLADLAGRPLDDPRTELVVGDVADHIGARPAPYDAILLDVDNGPDPLASDGNARLYSQRGLRRIARVLRPGGVLVVWSAYESPPFLHRLRKADYEPERVRVKSRGKKGSRHTLYVGRRRKPG